MRSRIPAIARKETLHILRDWRTLALAFMMPLIMILLFAYAITFDIRNVRMAVADEDGSSASRALVDRFTGSGYFRLVTKTEAARLPLLLDRGLAQITLRIPKDYAKRIERMEPQTVQVIFDGSENNTANISAGYVDAIFSDLNLDLVREALGRYGLPTTGIPPVRAETRVWFNPTLSSTNTIVPALIGVIMLAVAALLSSLTVVREREQGSLEGLIATPVKKYEVLVGKMLPFLAISLFDCMMMAVIAVVIFAVPFAGSLFWFTVAAVVFSIAGLSIGLFASVVASNQLLANQIVVISTMLPAFLLSGFMFAIKSMPQWVRTITYAVPARYFISICRGIMLKDQPPADLFRPILFLVIFAAVVMSLAVSRFKKKLEG